MKKLLGVGVILLAMLLFVGCSDTSSTQSAEEEENDVATETTDTEVTEETKETEDTTPVVETDAETTEEDTIGSKAVIDYTTIMTDHLLTLTDFFNDFGELNTLSSQNPSLINSDEWLMQVATQLNILETTIQEIRNVTPPPAVEEAHSYILQAMDHYQFIVDNYPNAIDTLDADLLNQCISEMQEGSFYMSQATDMILELAE